MREIEHLVKEEMAGDKSKKSKAIPVTGRRGL
jgi:hypothetical protein